MCGQWSLRAVGPGRRTHCAETGDGDELGSGVGLPAMGRTLPFLFRRREPWEGFQLRDMDRTYYGAEGRGQTGDHLSHLDNRQWWPSAQWQQWSGSEETGFCLEGRAQGFGMDWAGMWRREVHGDTGHGLSRQEMFVID